MNRKQIQKIGTCPCCGRRSRLTFHHLIPRKLHRRTRFKKQYTKSQLNEGIFICRLCHNGIHDRYTEMQLAKQFSSLESLTSDALLKKHFDWVARQKRQL